MGGLLLEARGEGGNEVYTPSVCFFAETIFDDLSISYKLTINLI